MAGAPAQLNFDEALCVKIRIGNAATTRRKAEANRCADAIRSEAFAKAPKTALLSK